MGVKMNAFRRIACTDFPLAMRSFKLIILPELIKRVTCPSDVYIT